MKHKNRWNARETKPRQIRKRGLRISLTPGEGNGLRYEGTVKDEVMRPVPVTTTLTIVRLEPEPQAPVKKRGIEVAPSPDLPGDFYCRNGSARNWRPRMTL